MQIWESNVIDDSGTAGFMPVDTIWPLGWEFAELLPRFRYREMGSLAYGHVDDYYIAVFTGPLSPPRRYMR